MVLFNVPGKESQNEPVFTATFKMDISNMTPIADAAAGAILAYGLRGA